MGRSVIMNNLQLYTAILLLLLGIGLEVIAFIYIVKSRMDFIFFFIIGVILNAAGFVMVMNLMRHF